MQTLFKYNPGIVQSTEMHQRKMQHKGVINKLSYDIRAVAHIAFPVQGSREWCSKRRHITAQLCDIQLA